MVNSDAAVTKRPLGLTGAQLERDRKGPASVGSAVPPAEMALKSDRNVESVT